MTEVRVQGSAGQFGYIDALRVITKNVLINVWGGEYTSAGGVSKMKKMRKRKREKEKKEQLQGNYSLLKDACLTIPGR